ncbi:MAG: sulfate adenylyltransferase [Candidatus Palauibacterales bacterium]|nr:sulfate adenylyltransferase [Candidatus Palauibacterales bacterium]MDP2483426.1 sulfate adenylyltransferase [Candidatus Palauibacterales bacterium]
MTIQPYGGVLVNREASSREADDLRAAAGGMPSVQISPWTLSDLYLIAVGGLSPLEGFMDEASYRGVLDEMKLPGGLPWSIPVVLPVTGEEAEQLAVGQPAALYAPDGKLAAVVDVTDIFDRDREAEAEAVFRTPDQAHPGVAAMYRMGHKCVAGPIRYVYDEDITGFPEDHLTPSETRAAFAERGWETVVAFQTRNPIHRAHEYLQKCALEVVDGLLVHPLVGETKSDDIPADVRMECYRVILDRYYPADRVLLSVLPAAMRYAGPREAIFHSIMRRNYGCTHFIVGRDHAGVGDYYGTYDAQRIFDEVDMDLLGIEPMKFEHSFYCLRTKQMATSKTSPSSMEERLFLSGTKVREMLSRGESPPEEFTRPEIAAILMKSYQGQVSAD